MKLEFLAEGSPDCPLIRLYEFSNDDVVRLRSIADELSNGRVLAVDLHDEPGVEPVDGCSLKLRRGKRDLGIAPLAPLEFECVLSDEGWVDVSWLLRPFCERQTRGYQWLVSKGPISLLLSPDGNW